MNKFLVILSNIVPVVKKFLYPNGKFRVDRASLVVVTFAIILIAIHFLGIEKVTTSLEILQPIVVLFGVEPVQ